MTADAPDPARSSFPTWVAAGSLTAALLLFFGSMVPALAERDALRVDGAELKKARAQYEMVIQHLRPGAPGAADLQSVLVAIDRLGWTPEELLRHYPDQGRR
jgi:hypothetical protein